MRARGLFEAVQRVRQIVSGLVDERRELRLPPAPLRARSEAGEGLGNEHRCLAVGQFVEGNRGRQNGADTGIVNERIQDHVWDCDLEQRVASTIVVDRTLEMATHIRLAQNRHAFVPESLRKSYARC
jgi:hypothetical protein